MSEDLFDDFIATGDTSSQNSKTAIVICPHTNTVESGASVLCVECGEEVDKTIVYDKEWRYYGHMDSKHKTDPTRCKSRKVDVRNIFKDVEGKIFDDNVVMMANDFYTRITNGNIHRGESRKGIVFSCVYYAYKQLGNPRACENLADIFKIERKTSLKGLKYFRLNIEQGTIKNTTQITPANLVTEIMDRFSATPEQKSEVIALYEKIKDRSSKINRSRPQSVASGLTYYWICNSKKRITLKEFVDEIGLSELTVIRIAKEIATIINDVVINDVVINDVVSNDVVIEE